MLLQWVDILYTEEGAIEAMLGKEGDMYIINEDNQWQWKGGVDKVTSSQLYELSIYDSGEMPWLFPQDFYSRYAEQSVTRMTQKMLNFARCKAIWAATWTKVWRGLSWVKRI